MNAQKRVNFLRLPKIRHATGNKGGEQRTGNSASWFYITKNIGVYRRMAGKVSSTGIVKLGTRV